MLGFGALGELALGEGPNQIQGFSGGQWQAPIRKTGLAVAVIATTFAGFVAPPQPAQAGPFTQFSQPQPSRVNLPDEQPSALFEIKPPPVISIAFTQFSQPQFARNVIPDEQPSALFEVLPPTPAPFTGFSAFEGVIKARFNVALVSWNWWQPIILPVDTHDGVWVKKKRKPYDAAKEELETRRKRRAAIEFAIHGPEPVNQPAAPLLASTTTLPPNVDDLARAIMGARDMHAKAQRNAIDRDDDDVIELILRDL